MRKNSTFNDLKVINLLSIYFRVSSSPVTAWKTLGDLYMEVLCTSSICKYCVIPKHYSIMWEIFPTTKNKGSTPISFLAWRINCAHLLQLMIMSSGMIRLFSMPILGWLPRPRKSPGGSILKLAILSLWLSITQKPYSFSNFSFSSLIFWKTARSTQNRFK